MIRASLQLTVIERLIHAVIILLIFYINFFFSSRSVGNASDSFDYNRNASFFTMEKDTPDGCAKKYGAWWYPNNKTCGNSNLNGQYKQIDGLRWARWSQYGPRELQYTATKAEMKIKPDCFG